MLIYFKRFFEHEFKSRFLCTYGNHVLDHCAIATVEFYWCAPQAGALSASTFRSPAADLEVFNVSQLEDRASDNLDVRNPQREQSNSRKTLNVYMDLRIMDAQ